MNKKEITRILTELKTFEKTKLELEQYQTECDIAATITWHAYMSKEVEGKKVADLGCGNGILGIAALILGAKEVIFIDIDKDAIKIAKDNLKHIEKKLDEKYKAKFTARHCTLYVVFCNNHRLFLLNLRALLVRRFYRLL